ncbi:hypothetical protein [Microbacterium gallinarum]|uniref:Uncharacterized protein n=1 Tax=Microbacterium gallinarum TaxID=2762209 RepID=A0ABR8WZE1_9MICO|nr:hypothetical protein [Microbacterium gallinarum]MBD8022046.1 hypothetical protein [Microbacterium gallinarum]
MILDVDTLLAGPRGRRVCLEYARGRADRARGAEPAPERLQDPSDAATALWWAALRLDPAFGTSTVLTLGTYEPGPDEGPTVTAAEAASAVDALELGAPTAADLRNALAISVDVARYWQEPDGDDILAATDEMVRALRRVAEVIVASPHAGWWATPVARDDQWTVGWEGTRPDPPERVAAMLDEWREDARVEEQRAAIERPADPTANWGGTWWSIPPAPLVSSTRRLGADGPAGLWFVEDTLGWQTAAATPLDVHAGRVIEIDGPDAWIDLCRRHPLVVTASRRHEWYRTTGRVGDWVQPDWSKVVKEAEGVHLSVAGYLSSAGLALDVGDGRASMIAGWNPDATYWFAGVSPRPAEQQQWRTVDDGWERVSD